MDFENKCSYYIHIRPLHALSTKNLKSCENQYKIQKCFRETCPKLISSLETNLSFFGLPVERTTACVLLVNFSAFYHRNQIRYLTQHDFQLLIIGDAT